jgi:predicted adenine nucleotide alpha hydrolase (AANH) superfamily ATPase
MHICCGPCAVYPVDVLRKDGHDLRGYFFNPNIHPFQEYTRRRDTLEKWAGDIDLPVVFDPEYDLEGFLRQTVYRETERCRFCYQLRLERAAKVAKRGKYDALSTTLLYSKFQKHDLIVEIGREVAAANGLAFYYQDFREGWKQGIEQSKSLGMYRQQYCGCVYSEKERFYRPPELISKSAMSEEKNN